jgi:hypothetical protein
MGHNISTRHNHPAEEIEAARTRLVTAGAVDALDRALKDAPPLRAEQVAFIRDVVSQHGSDES